MHKFNGTAYYTNYIQDLLLKYIDDIEKPGTGVTYADFPNSGVPPGSNIYDSYFTPFIPNYTQIITDFTGNQANLTFGINANIVNLFQNNPIAGGTYATVPVKVYRHLVQRLRTHLNTKLLALQPVALNNNKYNLYIETDAAASASLTTSKPIGIFNDLSRFKQLIPDVNPVMKGGKSKSINKIKIGGSKTKISSKKIQKGGARNTLFVDVLGLPNNVGAPRLYANRKLKEFEPALFKNAVKKYKELNFKSRNPLQAQKY
jgi:hypothetical protein